MGLLGKSPKEALRTVDTLTWVTYRALYPTKYFSFTLQGYADKTKWVIGEVDKVRHPELANVSKGDVIKSINGVPVDGYPQHVINYVMRYGMDNALKLVLENKRHGLYEVTAKALLMVPLLKIDYCEANKKADHLRLKKRSIDEHTEAFYERCENFNPSGNPNGRLVSPGTDWILPHFREHSAAQL